jgi:hypothetical protein
MSLELTPAAKELRGRQSCVYDVRWSAAGLFVFVETYPPDSTKCVNYEIYFGDDRGFFVLDDADLPSSLKFPRLASGHVLYEVSAGGWLQSRPLQSLSVASTQCREWLVATGNECVSVFAERAPTIRRLQHDAT